MGITSEKTTLKKLRLQVKEMCVKDELSREISDELIDDINIKIGRINCCLTNDDEVLEELAQADGLRD